MLPWSQVMATREHQQDLWRDAEKQRLVLIAEKAQQKPFVWKIARRVFGRPKAHPCCSTDQELINGIAG